MKYEMVPVVFAMAGLFFSCSARRPGSLGITGGRLSPCPATPNCVSTQDKDPKHRIEPISYRGSLEDATKTMREVIMGMKRAYIVKTSDTYIHAEFTSAIFRFVDDVEIYFDDNAKIIHIRSASRVGYGDFNVNRKRTERIRELYRAR